MKSLFKVHPYSMLPPILEQLCGTEEVSHAVEANAEHNFREGRHDQNLSDQHMKSSSVKKPSPSY